MAQSHSRWSARWRTAAYLLVSVLLLLAVGCEERQSTPVNSINLDPTGSLTGFGECKSFDKSTSLAQAPDDQDCIRYDFVMDGTLALQHINAGFNCCPGDITANIDIADHVITIVEKESLENGGCDCLCLFDVDYRIAHLEPGEYKIELVELYLDPGDEKLTFSVDLTTPTAGVWCVDRKHYPWNGAP